MLGSSASVVLQMMARRRGASRARASPSPARTLDYVSYHVYLLPVQKPHLLALGVPICKTELDQSENCRLGRVRGYQSYPGKRLAISVYQIE